jgi:hypothetical protein
MLQEDVEFINRYLNDIKSILTTVCGFNKIQNSKLIEEAEIIDNRLKNM